MEFFTDNQVLSDWLIHYGSIALFLLLFLGIVALPIPEETLMILAGILMNSKSLNIPSTVLAAYAGSICGISTSYLLGRTLGHYFLVKYGGWLGIKESHIEQVHRWFERYGKWTLLFGYFIPGVRHFTGFSSGMTNLEFKQFALFAYTGAIVWASTFLSLGYFCSGYCISIFERLELDTDKVIILLFGILISYLIYLSQKKPARTHKP